MVPARDSGVPGERDVSSAVAGSPNRQAELALRSACVPRWHRRIFELLPNLALTLLIGRYAQEY